MGAEFASYERAPGARRVEQHAIEAAHHFGEVSSVVAADDSVANAETVQVRDL